MLPTRSEYVVFKGGMMRVYRNGKASVWAPVSGDVKETSVFRDSIVQGIAAKGCTIVVLQVLAGGLS